MILPSQGFAAPEPTPPSGPAPKRLLLVDDHPVVCEGLARVLETEPGISICGTASSAPEALEKMRRHEPGLVILDVSLRGTNGIELIKLMRAEQPRLAILVFSVHDESLYALRALRAGAKGYIMKGEPVETLLAAVRRILDGGMYLSARLSERLVFQAIHAEQAGQGSPVDKLSDRELEVLQLLGRGFGTREIANELHLSIKTIETHRAHVKEKLRFHDAGEMVRFAMDWVAREQE